MLQKKKTHEQDSKFLALHQLIVTCTAFLGARVERGGGQLGELEELRGGSGGK